MPSTAGSDTPRAPLPRELVPDPGNHASLTTGADVTTTDRQSEASPLFRTPPPSSKLRPKCPFPVLLAILARGEIAGYALRKSLPAPDANRDDDLFFFRPFTDHSCIAQSLLLTAGYFHSSRSHGIFPLSSDFNLGSIRVLRHKRK